MKKIGGIHIFENRAFLRRITHMSLAVIAGGVVVAAVWFVVISVLGHAMGVAMPPFELSIAFGSLGARLMGIDPEAAHLNPLWGASIALVIVASLAVHELVHGFFFRQYAPPGSRVTFGANLKMGMLYASAEGIIYTRQQYLVIAVAPSIVVTLLLVAIGIGLKWPLWTIIVATAHLSGCTGDWGYIRTILGDPSITHCEDTSWGVEFYGDDASTAEDKGGVRLEVVPGTAVRARTAPADAEAVDGAAGHVAVTGDVRASGLEPDADEDETSGVDAGPGFAGVGGSDASAAPVASVRPAESDASAAANFTVVDGGKRA